MRRLQNFFNGFLIGERNWGCFRIFFFIFMMILFSYLGYLAFGEYRIDDIVDNWNDRAGFLDFIPRILVDFAALIYGNYRFLWISLMGFLMALIISASYLQIIYLRPRIRETFNYLRMSLFGFDLTKLGFSRGYPIVEIDDGNMLLENNEDNLIRDIGGPGWVTVHPGNVVLFEHLDKPSRVEAQGSHFISRFETVRRFLSDAELDGREIPTIDERHGFVELVSVVTKDRITVIIEEINYRYRLRMGREFGDFVNRDPKNPNPFSIQAVKDMAYNRTVRLNRETHEPELTPWHAMVNIAVEAEITRYIQLRRFNEIVVPRFPDDPRQVITDRIFNEAIRTRLRTFGAELLWWDIGHFRIADPMVADQLVQNWGTIWRGESAFRIARGEAERIKNMELGRAEAQAEMLQETMEAFQRIGPEHMGPRQVRNVLLARLTQLLDNLANSQQLPGSTRDINPPL